MKLAPLGLVALALVPLACGGGGGNEAKQTKAPPPKTPTTSEAPTATTGVPPARHRRAVVRAHRQRHAALRQLHATVGYSCGGKRLRGLSAVGPVKVSPAVVRPGDAFTVTVTDRATRVADVSLTGVSTKPILAHGRYQNGHVTAVLHMPRGVRCGNKLLEVEGDVSATAYVGVGR